jgi:hypothetical protein
VEGRCWHEGYVSVRGIGLGRGGAEGEREGGKDGSGRASVLVSGGRMAEKEGAARVSLPLLLRPCFPLTSMPCVPCLLPPRMNRIGVESQRFRFSNLSGAESLFPFFLRART